MKNTIGLTIYILKRCPLFLLFIFMSETVFGQFYHEKLSRNSDLTFKEIVDKTEKYYDQNSREKGTGYKQYQRWKYWTGRSLDENGKPINNAEALSQYNQFLVANRSTRRFAAGSYEELGPKSSVNTASSTSALGRVSAVGLDPNNENHIIVGSPTGGVWKTIDYGVNWTPIFDDQLLMDVYALEISHTDPNIYLVGIDGGVMKSIDGGTNWNVVDGVDPSDRYNTITMHPTDPNVVFVVGQENGRVYKSADQGNSFYSVMEHSSTMYDLEFNPGNPNIIYASGDVVYKSIDAGESFSIVTSGLWSGLGQPKMMAVTPAAPSYLYVAEAYLGGFNALYLSTDEGVTWSMLADNSCECQNFFGYTLDVAFEGQSRGQAPRDMDIVVSPQDQNIIHLAGIVAHRTTDLGQSWMQTSVYVPSTAFNFMHADTDILIYDNNRIVSGTDGGIYISTNEGTSWTDISVGLGIQQLYRIGASQTDPDRVSAGSQDNGTGILKSGIWYNWTGADGTETFIDWSNADIVYGATQGGNLAKSIDGGQTRTSINTPGGSGVWVTPFEQDPINPNTIYTARRDVWKSTNGGISWDSISTFNIFPVNGYLITAMKIAPSNNNYIYVALDRRIYYTRNGGISWNASPVIAEGINYISVNPYDPNKLAVALTGSSDNLIESTDGAESWTDISANMPPVINIECVLYEPRVNGGLYCGGKPGVYYTASTANANWEDISSNLPKVRVTELEIRNEVLYVGTYGRGLWKLDLDCDGSLIGQACSDLDACIVNGIYDAECNCIGTYADADNDTVCDNEDICPGGDDRLDEDNDGIPDFCDSSCGGIVYSDCGVTVEVSGLTVTLHAIPDPGVQIIKVRTSTWSFQDDLCNNWVQSTLCTIGNSVTVNQTGTFVIDIQGDQDCTFDIIVEGGSVGVDNDGDGICAEDDCDDNNSNLPYPVDIQCDDGDPNTINDVIPTGQCLCVGTPVSCNIPYTCTSNLVCINLIGNVLSVNTNGNSFTFLNIHTTDFSLYESLCANWNDSQPCLGTVVSSALPEGNYLVRIEDTNEPNEICWIPFSVVDTTDENCVEDIIQSDNSIVVNSQYAQSSIISDGVVMSQSYIEFAAGNEIQMLENFEVEMGAVFEAFIQPCGN